MYYKKMKKINWRLKMDEDVIFVLFVLLILVGFFSFIVYMVNLKVEAEDRAQELCEIKGYETFITFKKNNIEFQAKSTNLWQFGRKNEI